MRTPLAIDLGVPRRAHVRHCYMTDISDSTDQRIARAWSDILADIAAGELVKEAHGKRNISRGEIRAFLARAPARRIEWDEAREASADAFADEALEVSRTPNTTQVEASDARTRIDTLKWAARIRNPRLYGDRNTVDLNVRTVDLTRIISDANARLEASKALGRVIEGEVIRQALPAELGDLL